MYSIFKHTGTDGEKGHLVLQVLEGLLTSTVISRGEAVKVSGAVSLTNQKHPIPSGGAQCERFKNRCQEKCCCLAFWIPEPLYSRSVLSFLHLRNESLYTSSVKSLFFLYVGVWLYEPDGGYLFKVIEGWSERMKINHDSFQTQRADDKPSVNYLLSQHQTADKDSHQSEPETWLQMNAYCMTEVIFLPYCLHIQTVCFTFNVTRERKGF